MDPLVSVVIPVYKAEPYVAACLESVLNQTYRKLEVIAVSDCTPDASMQSVARYAAADPRLRVLENERNMGTMQTRERGYREAHGTFVFFLDADDTIRPQAIEQLLRQQKGTDADIVAGAFVYHKQGGGRLSAEPLCETHSPFPAHGPYLSGLSPHDYLRGLLHAFPAGGPRCPHRLHE